MCGVLCIGKCLLIIINTILLLNGLILFAVGIIFLAMEDLFGEMGKKLEEAAVSKLKDDSEALGQKLNKTDHVSLYQFQAPMGKLLASLGGVLLILSLIGLVGVCCALRKALIAFIVLFFIVFLSEFIMFILVSNGSFGLFDSSVRNFVKGTLKNYRGVIGSNRESILWNSIMYLFKCCGVNDYTDFHDLAEWPPYYLIQKKDNAKPKTPFYCCKKLDLPDIECAVEPTPDNNNMWTGCYTILFERLFNNPWTGTLYIVTLLSQFIMITLACFVGYKMGNNVENLKFSIVAPPEPVVEESPMNVPVEVPIEPES